MSSDFTHYPLDEIDGREAYRLLTSLVVPRPIAWVSTLSAAGVPNLAPFSYFTALSADPMLVGISIGARRSGEPKDSLRNVRDTGHFCVNVVTERQLERMNATAAALPPEGDEFLEAGLGLGWTEQPRIPYVADCPAVLDCELHQEVDLAPARATFVIGRVRAIRVSNAVLSDDPYSIDPDLLRPVGRLGGNLYALPGATGEVSRP